MSNTPLNDHAANIHKRNVEAGWWPHGYLTHSQETYATKIALIHSEVTEMLEGLRKGEADTHLPNRSMEEVEAADILIRLFDYAGARNLDLDGALTEKLAYNQARLDHKRENRASAGGKKF